MRESESILDAMPASKYRYRSKRSDCLGFSTLHNGLPADLQSVDCHDDGLGSPSYAVGQHQCGAGWLRLLFDGEKPRESGWGGIRTPGRVNPTPVFKTGALNRSATHPAIEKPAFLLLFLHGDEHLTP